MRTLPKLSGIAVLILSFFGLHVIHHLYVGAPHDHALFWPGLAIACGIDILAFIGGYLLLTQSR